MLAVTVDLSDAQVIYWIIYTMLDKGWIIYFIPGVPQKYRGYSDLALMSSEHFLWAGFAA